MKEFLERVKEIVEESRQFGKSRLLREYLDEIDRLAGIELEILERQEPHHDD